jgi:hypothetical protein
VFVCLFFFFGGISLIINNSQLKNLLDLGLHFNPTFLTQGGNWGWGSLTLEEEIKHLGTKEREDACLV